MELSVMRLERMVSGFLVFEKDLVFFK